MNVRLVTAALVWGAFEMSSLGLSRDPLPEPSELLTAPLPSAFVFKAPAHFEASDIRAMRPEIERLARLNLNVVMDFARTEAIDGSGVGALVYVFKRLAADGKRLSIRNVSGQPLALLNAAGLLRTLGTERPEGLLRATMRWLRARRAARAIYGPPINAPKTAAGERNKGAA